MNDNVKTRLSWITSFTLCFLPVLIIQGYPTLRDYGEYGMSSALYAGCYALAATVFESRWSRKIIRSVVTAAVGMWFGTTFDAVMILGVAIAVSAIAVGVTDVFGRSLWKAVLYRLVRIATAFGLVITTFCMHLPTSGNCPAGGGDITEVFITFTIMTYVPLIGILLVDYVTRKKFGWKSRSDNSEPVNPLS